MPANGNQLSDEHLAILKEIVEANPNARCAPILKEFEARSGRTLDRGNLYRRRIQILKAARKRRSVWNRYHLSETVR